MTLQATPLSTERCDLEPLTIAHAREMAGVLAPTELYDIIGGEAPSEEALLARYRRQVVGRSPSGAESWLNWIVRDRATGAAIGYVQATVVTEATSGHELIDAARAIPASSELPSAQGRSATAEVAWLISPAWQGSGFATETAAEMIAWLGRQGVTRIRAHIHPAHEASARVARRVGLVPTGEAIDGETVWVLADHPRPVIGA